MIKIRRLITKFGTFTLAYLLILPASQAQPLIQSQLNWPAFEQYQASGQLLNFSAHSSAQGYLLIWPELNQAHMWLPMARHWQQRNWEVRLLLPDTAQQAFDPSSERPSPAQQAWLILQLDRLTALTDTNENADQDAIAANNTNTEQDTARPVVMLTQGSAALWYQQWVETEQLPVPQALVLFDALPDVLAQQKMLASSLARSPYPVLDIYSHPDSPLAWHNQQRRQQQLSSREKTGYALQRFIGAEPLNKQIAGWLVRLGWLPLPPNAPQYLQEQHSESGISRPRNAANPGPAATP
ncbi:MAG: alpha/beta hydrolase family protein [Candidatus Oceanisphaera merdipullorum]|nr:alpha/beta hydrolase family protein [Candidatus Oceanisphaera merdipullorum]